MTRIVRTLAVLICAALIGAAASPSGDNSALGGALTSGAANAERTSAANESAAQTEAASLLSELPLPPGATQSAAEPAADDSLLAHPGVMLSNPNVVDDHTWWLIPGAPADVLAYIRAHVPSGAKRAAETRLDGPAVPDNRAETFAWSPVAGVLSTRWLDIYIVQLPDGSTGLRADGQVVWVKPRPTLEVIPPGARILRISVHGSLKGEQPAQRPLRVTSAKKISAIVALLNALPAVQPGLRNCPADFGIGVRLALYASRGAPTLAVAKVDPQGCGGVQLTIGGTPQQGLEGGGRLIGQIDDVLGVTLNTSPPTSPEHAVLRDVAHLERGRTSPIPTTSFRCRITIRTCISR